MHSAALHFAAPLCLALTLFLPGRAAALLPEIPPLPPGPGEIAPVGPGRVGPGQPAPAPLPLAGATATLFVARTVSGSLNLTLTIRSARTVPVVLTVRRDNTQNCAFAPLLRVVRVGTQEVVYPGVGAQKRLCTQEVVTKSTAGRGNVSFSRELTLPAGEYMLESWFTGLADGVLVKVPALPVRVTVK